jgi:Flp pilus assembly protein TadG
LRSRSEHLGRALSSESGAVNANAVIIFPLLLVILMALVQWGLYYHGQSLEAAAAQDAARAAQGVDGTVADGRTVAEGLLAHERASGLLEDVAVDITTTNGTVRVDVRAKVRSIVPLPFARELHGEAQGPAERFVAETDR